MISSTHARLLTPLHLKGIVGSTAVHVGALAAGIAYAWLLHSPATRPEFAGHVRSIRLEATRVLPEPQPLVEQNAWEMPVVVMPDDARIEERHFVRTQTRLLRPQELDAVVLEQAALPKPMVGAAERDEELLAQLTARPEAASPARHASDARPVFTPPQAPLPAGTSEKTPPRFHNNPPPVYPAEAIRKGLEGRTLLRLTISASGRVEQVEVATSSGHPILDAAAVAAVRRWTGEPARIGSHPVATVELLPVFFRLEDD